MTSPTHSTKVARLVAADGAMTYAKALSLAKQARADGLLPEIMDADGIAVSVDIIKSIDRRALTTLPPPSVPTYPLLCSTQDLRGHAAIIGSTPADRTTLAAQLVTQMLAQGMPGVVLDLSGFRRDFLKSLSTYGTDLGFGYNQVSDDGLGNRWINPLEGIGPDEATDLILSVYRPDDEYWRALNERVARALVNLCYKAHELSPAGEAPYPTLGAIGLILEGDLELTTKKLRGLITEDKELYQVLVTHNSDIAKSAKALGAKLMALLTRTSASSVLTPRAEPPAGTQSRGLTYVGVDYARQSEVATLVATGLLTRVNTELSANDAADERFLVILDSVFAPTNIVTQIVERAKSHGLRVILTADPRHLHYPASDSLLSGLNVTMVLKSTNAKPLDASKIDLDALSAAAATGESNVTQDIVRSLDDNQVLVHVKSLPGNTDFVEFYR